METKHTPGPWCIAQDIHDGRIGISSTSGVVIHAPFTMDKMKAGVQGIENARLIAAAPDMLAALKALVQRYDTGDELSPEHPIIKGNAAIAKATGTD